jgi:hypothetical protein
MEKALSREEIREILAAECRRCGSQLRFAGKADTPASNISEMVNGIRPVSQSAARALGYRKVTVYVPISGGQHE